MPLEIETRKLECDTYLIERTYKKFFSFTKYYYIRERETGDNIFFAKSPAFQIRKKIHVFCDEQLQQKYLSLFRYIFPPLYPRYVIKDANGVVVGYIKRKFPLLRGRWRIFNSKNIKIGSLRENLKYFFLSNLRFFDFSFTFYHNFIFSSGNQELGEIDAEINLSSCKLLLNLTRDPERKIGRRLALALIFLVDDVVYPAGGG